MPPSLAMAMAILLSVTVSMAADTNGIFKVISLVSLVAVFTSRGRTSECLGMTRTSSNVSPSNATFELDDMANNLSVICGAKLRNISDFLFDLIGEIKVKGGSLIYFRIQGNFTSVGLEHRSHGKQAQSFGVFISVKSLI